MNSSGDIKLAFVVYALLAVPALADDGSDAYVLSRAGDADQGRQIFARCRSCHNLEGGARTRTGPNLDGLFGRVAGSSTSYTRYSQALAASGIVWTEANINDWISDPGNFLPGNKMALAPVRDRQDRMDLIAYLREALK